MNRNSVLRQFLATLAFLAVFTLPTAAETLPETVDSPLASEAREATSPAEDAINRLRQAQDAKQRADTPDESRSKAEQPFLGGSAKSLGYFFIFLLAGLSLLKRFQKGNKNANGTETIKLCARRQLTSRSALLIIEAGEQRLLLAQNGDDLSLLTELHEPALHNEASIALFDAEEATNTTRAAVG